MSNAKFASGAFVFFRARGLEARTPDEIATLLKHHPIDPAIAPTYAGDRTAVSRAISYAASGLSRKGVLLRPLRRASSEVAYAIIREHHVDDHLEHAHESTFGWKAEPDPSVIEGDHPVALHVAAAYAELRGKIVSEDWSASINAFLERHDAARVRRDGRIFWSPPQTLPEIHALGDFLAEVGIDLVLCEIEAENQEVVQTVAHESLEEQLDKLQQEAAEFDGTQKPTTYTRRLDEYQRLRERAVLYREALGLGVDKAEQVLAELEQKVSTMLDLRLQTVVHRDGTVSGATEAVAEELPAAGVSGAHALAPEIHFAGATFIPTRSGDPTLLTFVSDDEYACSSVKALEAMGLAGQWQQAGACQVAIQNSGPPGASVSIRLRLPAGEDLAAMIHPLANLGIEVITGTSV